MGTEIDVSEPSGGDNANDLAILALSAIQENRKDSFDNVYMQISRRTPKPDSDWLHNDLLLFALVLGTVKFKENASWLRETLLTRIDSTDGENQLIAQTLMDVVTGNWDTTNNHGPLLIAVKHILGLPLGSVEYVNTIYRQLSRGSFPPHESNFLNVISLRAMDAIILSKQLEDLDWRLAVNRFLDAFQARVEQLAFWGWLLIVFAVLGCTAYFSYRYLNAPTKDQRWFEVALDLWPLLGVPSVLAFILSRQRIVTWLKRPLFWFFGYPAGGCYAVADQAVQLRALSAAIRLCKRTID